MERGRERGETKDKSRSSKLQRVKVFQTHKKHKLKISKLGGGSSCEKPELCTIQGTVSLF
jgi:hypothetical protein